MNKYLATKYWISNKVNDKTEPIWTSKVIETKTDDNTSSSIRGYGILFYPKTYDKISKKIFGANKDILLEIQYENQICVIEGDDYFAISFSICGSNMNFPTDKLCPFRIKLLDNSGNYSNEDLQVAVLTKTQRMSLD